MNDVCGARIDPCCDFHALVLSSSSSFAQVFSEQSFEIPEAFHEKLKILAHGEGSKLPRGFDNGILLHREHTQSSPSTSLQ
jgi:hypothetical protein